MTTLLNPIITKSDSIIDETTYHRFNLMFTPIQKTDSKEADFSSYALNPLIDFFILETVFAIDMCISLLNAFASVAKACYLWTESQQKSPELLDDNVHKELEDLMIHAKTFCASYIASSVNTTLSMISLLTRPLASLASMLCDLSTESTHTASPASK